MPIFGQVQCTIICLSFIELRLILHNRQILMKSAMTTARRNDIISPIAINLVNRNHVPALAYIKTAKRPNLSNQQRATQYLIFLIVQTSSRCTITGQITVMCFMILNFAFGIPIEV